MARNSRSFASIVNKWKIMVSGYEKHKSDLSFAQNDSNKLKELTTRAESLNVKQEQLKADLQKTTAELNSAMDEGDKASASILRYAKAKYGPKSLEIKDFAVKGEK